MAKVGRFGENWRGGEEKGGYVSVISSVQSGTLTDSVVGGGGGDMTDDSADILFQSFLQQAVVSTSGMGRAVHFLTMSIQHFLCRPQRRPPSKVPLKDVF